MNTQAIPIPSDATIGKAIPIPSDATIGQAFSSPAAAIASGASPEAIQSATQRDAQSVATQTGKQINAQHPFVLPDAKKGTTFDQIAAATPNEMTGETDPDKSAKDALGESIALAPFLIPGVGGEGTLIGQIAKGAAVGAGVGAVTHAGGAMVAGHIPTAKGTGEAAATGAVIGGVASPLLRLAKVSALIRQIPGISKYLPALEEAGLGKPGTAAQEAGYEPPVTRVPFKGGTQAKVTYEQVPGPDTAGKGNLLTPAAKRGEAGAGAELTRRGRVVLHEGQPDVGRPRTVIHFDENQMPVIEHIHGEPTIEQIEPETGHNGSSPENPVSRESISAKQKFRITDSKGNVINPNVSAHDARGGLVKVGKGRTVQVWEPTLKRWIDF